MCVHVEHDVTCRHRYFKIKSQIVVAFMCSIDSTAHPQSAALRASLDVHACGCLAVHLHVDSCMPAVSPSASIQTLRGLETAACA